MSPVFAIPGLMQPVLSPEQYRAVSVVDMLDLVVLETATPENPVAPRVELRSRGGAFLHRENLGPQFLMTEEKSGVTTYRLRWPVDVPPNDYEVVVVVDGNISSRIPFNVARTPELRTTLQAP